MMKLLKREENFFLLKVILCGGIVVSTRAFCLNPLSLSSSIPTTATKTKSTKTTTSTTVVTRTKTASDLFASVDTNDGYEFMVNIDGENSVFADDKDDTKFESITMRNNNGGLKSSSSLSSLDRRKLFSDAFKLGCTITGITTSFVCTSTTSNAVMTDETDNFADNYWSSKRSSNNKSADDSATIATDTVFKTPTDEIVIRIPNKELKSKEGIGLELADIEFRTNRRVYVKTISPGSIADKLGIEKSWIVVAVNNESTERTNVEGVATMIYKASNNNNNDDNDDGGYIEIKFRNPIIFQNQLNNFSPGGTATTQVAPSGDTTQRNEDGSVKVGRAVTSQDDQRLTVSQLIPPKMCNRGATTDDLLEISYIGRVVETGAIFDGSAVKIDGKGIPGRGDDVSLFFVLGKQPFGQFPPGWDVGMEGMCVGERRRLLIPPVLAYGSVGVPRRGIPPDATLQYDVTLVSLNGLATPQ